MTNDEEEQFILNEYLTARQAFETHKREMNLMQVKKNQLETRLEETKQAFVDYMVGNGLKETVVNNHVVRLGESYSVDAPDVDAIPEEFVRIKTIREPNKILIREKRPAGNWYAIKESYKLTVE